MRELRTETKAVWDDLDSGQEVVLTSNGKPAALVIDIPDGQFDQTVQAVRQAKAMIALNSMRNKAARQGFKTDEEIDALIDEAREQG